MPVKNSKGVEGVWRKKTGLSGVEIDPTALLEELTPTPVASDEVASGRVLACDVEWRGDLDHATVFDEVVVQDRTKVDVLEP